MKKLFLHNISIHTNFHQNCNLKRKKLKYHSLGVPESRSFLVRYRKTYVLDNNNKNCMLLSIIYNILHIIFIYIQLTKMIFNINIIFIIYYFHAFRTAMYIFIYNVY